MNKHYEKDMAEQYNQYYQSGLYKTRYPSANPNVLSFIHTQLSLLPINPKSQILDFGCGQGRYLLALANTYNLHFIGYDISERAISDLEELLLLNHNTNNKIHLFCKKQKLKNYLEDSKPISLSLMMFGVLSHITQASERVKVLKENKAQLASQEGAILLSVPNRSRRFLFKQAWNIVKNISLKNSESIQYQRKGKIKLNYHLYTLSSLKQELALAGLEAIISQAESMLPEKWVLSHPFLAKLDKILCHLLPIQFAYGFLVLAKPKLKNCTQQDKEAR
ncbi:MAG: class I SAM-dependent methyltransferase [Marinomonas sp.]